jgi:cardiolipin synthase (CMP-forming)
MQQSRGHSLTRLPLGPTLLSAVRLPLAFAFPFTANTWGRLGLLAAAWISDGADGMVARRTGTTSRAGAVLDGATDRVFALTVLATFLYEGALSPLQLLLLLARDLFTTIGALFVWLRGVPVQLEARTFGKVVTGLQHAVILSVLIVPGAVPPVIGLVVVASFAAVLDYWRAARRSLRAARATGG